jgi:RimJ/RimL family protein N-acetyltransferase
MPAAELRTERLLLRPWRPADEAPMVAVNRDPEVTRYLNRPIDEAAVTGFHGEMLDHWERHGFGFYALESTEPASRGEFFGFAGFAYLPAFFAHLTDAPELGWRLAPAAWGRGLATEAARAALAAGLEERPSEEVISVIHPQNARSRSVATKLGMSHQRTVLNPLLGIDTHVWAPASF